MKKDKFTKNARNIFQKSILKKLIIFLLLVLSITFILSINFIPGRVTLKEGEVATKDIIARETIEYTDENATVKLKEEAAKSIREVYNLNLASIENVENELSNFFADLKELRNEYNASQSENDVLEIRDVNNYFNNNELIEIREKYSLNIEKSTISNLITIDTDSLQEIEQWLFLSIRKIMEQGIKEADIEEAKKQIAREISEQATNPYLAIIASEMGESFLKPSLFLDIEATEKKIQDSIDAVRDVKSIIRKDQIIIRKGEIVNAEHIEKMKALGLQNPILHYQNILGLFFIDSLFIF